MGSFIKLKKENETQIKGVKSSSKSAQVTSTGNDSLDFVIGGGIELNSILLLGEDQYGRYSNILTKLFLAESYHNQHKVYFANLDDDPREIFKDIPAGVEQEQNPAKAATSSNSSSETDPELRIAFRYTALPKIDSVQSSNSTNLLYDLAKKVEPSLTGSFEGIEYFGFNDLSRRQSSISSSAFDLILSDIKRLAESNSDNLLRICINSVGSALWYSENFTNEFLQFLAKLKSIVRYSDNVVCLITIPLHLINTIDELLIFKLRKLVDVNINLQSFDGLDKQTNAVFKQYNGLIHIKKVHSLSSLQSHKPETYDLAFKLKSHRFYVEKFHLPPELGDENKSSAPTLSCGSSGGKGNKSLDF